MIRPGFRSRLLLAAVLPALLLTGVFAAILNHWTRTVLESSLRERVEAVARQLATSSEFHLFTGDSANMRVLVDGLARDDAEIVSAAILDRDGRVWVSSGDYLATGLSDAPAWFGDTDRQRMRLVLPVANTPLHIDDFPGEFGGGGAGARVEKPMGYIVMRVSLASLDSERNRILTLAVAAFLLAALVGGGLAVFLARSVTAPLGHIVSVVGRIGRGDLTARIEVGADCVLGALVDDINRMAANVALTQEDMRRRIDEATRELQIQKLDAEREARCDPLTGLNNRRAFLEYAERDVLRALRYDFPVALIMLDLDHFKAVNDTYGHPVGDRVLAAVAEVLRQSTRAVDVVGRLGGEEFAILMPDADAEAALQAAERVRKAVEALILDADGLCLVVTASFGVAVYVRADDTIHDLFTRADRALYRAKQAGRNRVESFGDLS